MQQNLDLNSVLAQQQALINQASQNASHIMWGAIIVQILVFVLAVWAAYMFYARLRDIANELRQLRVAYQETHPTEIVYSHKPVSPMSRATGDESRYMPKA